jgi:nitrogenase-stabilizing/protective protein
MAARTPSNQLKECPAMNELAKRLAQLSSAEEFLDFFALSYEESVVHVNRLHILKRFYQYLRRDTEIASMSDEAVLYARYRSLLANAYDDFVKSTPAQEKVFKVFQDTDGQQSVSLDSLRSTLPTGVRSAA